MLDEADPLKCFVYLIIDLGSRTFFFSKALIKFFYIIIIITISTLKKHRTIVGPLDFIVAVKHL